MIKPWLMGLTLILSPLLAQASGSTPGCHLVDPKIDLTDKASLQRGARTFANYCLGCHSMEFQRYNRLAKDLAIPEELVKKNLMFTSDNIGDHMKISMPAAQAKQWFGSAPPDLSLRSRVKGEAWLYAYLRSFYLDDKRPFGVNNLCFPDVGMPHVLADLQGLQQKSGDQHHPELVLAKSGELLPEEYDQLVRDLVNFMTYVGEPVQVERRQLGVWVLLFLIAFTFCAWLLKREYWKDVH